MCFTGISFGRWKLLQSCSNLTLKPELEPTVIACFCCLAGRDAQEVLYTRFVQTPRGNLRQLRFLPNICNADIHKPAFSANTYTVVWFLKRELVKTIRWAFWRLFIIPLSLFASQAGDCSVLCALVFDELRPKVMCIHTKLIIVCRRLWAIKKRETPRSLDLLSLLQEQKYWISLDYTISGKQSDLWLVSLDSWRYRIS